MNAIKAIFAVVTSLCNVLLRILSATERGANALDKMAEAGEQKAENFKNLVKLEDDHKFETRKAFLNSQRATAGLPVLEVKSAKQQEEEKTKAEEEAKAKVEAAKQEAENALL